MTEKLTVADELEAFAHAYHNMQILDIDDDIIRSFVENFSEQFEFCDDETEETTSESVYRIYMKGTDRRWGNTEEYEFATREDAIAKIIDSYGYSSIVHFSIDPKSPIYWGNTYDIRKETTEK